MSETLSVISCSLIIKKTNMHKNPKMMNVCDEGVPSWTSADGFFPQQSCSVITVNCIKTVTGQQVGGFFLLELKSAAHHKHNWSQFLKTEPESQIKEK